MAENPNELTASELVESLEQNVGAYVSPPDDAQMNWLAKGLGMPLDASMCEKAGPKAGFDVGQSFYIFMAGKLRIALREDGMIAYVCEAEPDANDDEIVETLKICNFVDAHIPPSGHIHGLLAHQWVPVCEGSANTQPIWTQYCLPGESETVFPMHTLRLMSGHLETLWERSAFKNTFLGGYAGLAATTDDVLATVKTEDNPARGSDVFGRYLSETNVYLPQPVAGENVVKEGDAYKATSYGYVLLIDDILSVQPPLWIDAEGVYAYWCSLDSRSRPVTLEDVQHDLKEHGVVDGIKQGAIEELLDAVQEGNQPKEAHLIAEGIPPVHGQNAAFEIVVGSHNRSGPLRSDGSVDFRRVDLDPEVVSGQEIAIAHQPTAGKSGKNIYGNEIKGRDGSTAGIKAGTNVFAEEQNGEIHYFSRVGGVIKFMRNELSVVDLLIIEGDINYKTGNLEFKGEVFIKGSVGPNFTVSAESHITVVGNVESGATIMSKGNITVGKGIIGRKTRVMAVGHVQAQFVQDANVQCGRNLFLGSYANLAYLRAGARLKVNRAKGQRGGVITGGQTWAYRSIDICTAGTPNRTSTEVNVGVSPDQAEKLEQLDFRLQEANKLVVRYLQRFGLDHVDVAQIQNILKASTGPRQRVLALSAKQLGEAVQVQQKLIKEREKLRSSVDKLQQDAVIIMRDKIMPGVSVRVGDFNVKVNEVIMSPRYHIRKERLLVR